MGQKQAAYDAEGNIIAFHDTVDSPAPHEASVIDITDSQWLTCLGAPGQCRVSKGTLVQMPPPSAEALLDEAKANTINALNSACQSSILAGFTSSSVGVDSFYPTTDTDQRNLQSSALAAAWNVDTQNWHVPLWCRQGDAWAYVGHTARQVQQVNADWVAFRTASQQKYADAIARVRAATTIDAVQAITTSA